MAVSAGAGSECDKVYFTALSMSHCVRAWGSGWSNRQPPSSASTTTTASATGRLRSWDAENFFTKSEIRAAVGGAAASSNRIGASYEGEASALLRRRLARL